MSHIGVDIHDYYYNRDLMGTMVYLVPMVVLDLEVHKERQEREDYLEPMYEL